MRTHERGWGERGFKVDFSGEDGSAFGTGGCANEQDEFLGRRIDTKKFLKKISKSVDGVSIGLYNGSLSIAEEYVSL